MSDKIWIYEPTILLEKDSLTEILYNKEYSLERNINALTRLMGYLSLFSYVVTKNSKMLIYGIVGTFILVTLYFYMKTRRSNIKGVSLEEAFENPDYYDIVKNNYTMPTTTNPIMNVTQNEYSDDPMRERAAPSYTKQVTDEINQNVKANLDPRLFKNIGDEIDFENSMRSFYTTANTTIPNDQKAFMEFCYGNMPSCKEGSVLQCEKNNFRYNLR